MIVLLCAVVSVAGDAMDSGKTSPINKVLTMLTELQHHAVFEGRAEAKAYDKFACFCKSVTDEKMDAINDGQTEVDSLIGEINALNSDRNTADDKISELNNGIAELTKEMEAETKSHLVNKKAYEEERANITASITQINDGMKSIEAGADGESYKAGLITLKSGLQLADALGVSRAGDHKVLASLMQIAEDPKRLALAASYETNDAVDGLVDTMDNLRKDFLSQRKQCDATESKRVAAFDGFMQQRTDERKLKERLLKEQVAMKAEKQSEIAVQTKDLTEAQATLKDDQAYLQDLTAKCNAKSAEWDQRSQMRKSELSAITSSIDIISKRVKSDFLQVSSRKLRNSTADEASEDDDSDDNDDTEDTEGGESDDESDEEVDEESDDDDNTSFLQLAESPRSKVNLLTKKSAMAAKQPDSGVRDEIITLLHSKGSELKSAVLVKLADQMSAGGPFEKVKQLIQELVDRLSSEAADEATHKGWCDESIGKAKIARDDKVSNIKRLNTQVGRLETRRDGLAEAVERFTKEVDELTDTKSRLTKARDDEQAEHEKSIEDAEAGLSAIEDAIEVLRQFYAEDAKASAASFLALHSSTTGQDDPDDEAPDTGFDGAYEGNQDSFSGIKAMMEVIRSDFKRTITVTKDEEAEAVRDFAEIARTTDISKDTKTTEKEAKSNELASVRDTINVQMKELQSEQNLMDKTLEELKELRPACLDTAMSYEDKVARREEEVESLKQALEILDEQSR